MYEASGGVNGALHVGFVFSVLLVVPIASIIDWAFIGVRLVLFELLAFDIPPTTPRTTISANSPAADVLCTNVSDVSPAKALYRIYIFVLTEIDGSVPTPAPFVSAVQPPGTVNDRSPRQRNTAINVSPVCAPAGTDTVKLDPVKSFKVATVPTSDAGSAGPPVTTLCCAIIPGIIMLPPVGRSGSRCLMHARVR